MTGDDDKVTASNKRIWITAHIDPATHARLVRLAAKNDRSKSAEIRRAIATHLDAEDGAA